MGALIEIFRDGTRVATGMLMSVRGYQLRMSVANRTDRDFYGVAQRLRGSSVGLVFRNTPGDRTPLITADIKNSSRGERFTEIDLEVRDWQTLAAFWQAADD